MLLLSFRLLSFCLRPVFQVFYLFLSLSELCLGGSLFWRFAIPLENYPGESNCPWWVISRVASLCLVFPMLNRMCKRCSPED